MRHKKIQFVVIATCLGLVLSGCIKTKTTASANFDGTLTGSMTIESTKTDYQSLLDELSIDLGDQFSERYEVVNISLDTNSLNNCEVSDVTFEFEGTTPTTPNATHLSFSYVPAKHKNSLFVSGQITEGEDSDGFGHLYMEKGVIVPASGNAADCENFGSVSTGKLKTFATDIPIDLSLGSLKDLRQAPSSEDFNFAPALLFEQMSNLPEQDRGLYLILLELLLSGEMEVWADADMPEFKQCSKYRPDSKFNELFYRTFKKGELKKLVNSFPKIEVKKTRSIYSVTCNFTSVNLDYFDRDMNEPSSSERAFEEGNWLSNEEGLVWDFEMDPESNLEYSYAVNDPYYTVIEIDPDNVADGAEAEAFDAINRTLYKNVYSISGVILDTNGSMSADNKITFVNRPWHRQDATVYYLKGFEPTKYNMRSILGRVVEFKSNSPKISTSQGTLSKYVKALLKEKKNLKGKKELVVTGIHNAALPEESLEANMLLVEKRVKALQAKLKKLGWKARIATGYISDNDASSGDPKANNKVVIQYLPLD